MDTLPGRQGWARTWAREPPVPAACRHVVRTTSGHSRFAYLLMVALPPFPILPLGVKHSISDLCWASLLSLYLVSVNKDRSKQKDVIVGFTGRAEGELGSGGWPCSWTGTWLSPRWLTADAVDGRDGIRITLRGHLVPSWLNHMWSTLLNCLLIIFNNLW